MAAKTRAAAEPELRLSRVFNAPVALVWKAWTDPEHFKQWWGPIPFTCPFARMDVRPGGSYLWCMRSPDGTEHWTTGVFREVVPLERIVYSDSFADKDGRPVPPSHYGFGDDWPVELEVTVTFEALAGRTRMTLRHRGLPGATMGEMARAGWSQSLDKLAASLGERLEPPAHGMLVTLPTEREIVLIRPFQAPAALVFDAFAKPEHLRHWWGPKGYEMTLCEVDFRPGGRWRVVQRSPEGAEFGFRGEFREIVPPARIVRTFEFEGMPGHVSVETLTLLAQGPVTVAAIRSEFASAADRDGMLASGMARGAGESFERLAELLARLAGGR